MLNKKHIIALVLTLACLCTTTAMAQGLKQRMIERKPQIEALLAAGTVGENNAGFLEYRQGDKELSVVTEENADRQTVFTKIAQKAGTTAVLVGQRRAAHVARHAPAGTWLQNASGEWYRK